jgi:pimeloyl-ACP methyl ester carboxylesterase
VLVEEHKAYPDALAMVVRGIVAEPVESAVPASTIGMADFTDDDLTYYEAHGVPPLPPADASGFVEADGARVWYAAFGSGKPVLLLHGGMSNSLTFARQVPALTAAGYRAIVIDSRGQGRSTRDERPFSYAQMAADTYLVMDRLGISRLPIIGWSDGADIGLVMGKEMPERLAGLFFFACNADSSGPLPFVFKPPVGRFLDRARAEYGELSSTPGDFDIVFEAVGLMQRTQPEYTVSDLAAIRAPAWSVLGEHDEFIRREHAKYIADTMPAGRFVLLPGVSHFAHLQRPALFNRTMLDFLESIGW